ncbi:MAG: bifunctional glutamate N-acetyltransferase/amino-acid acetyltransferase ArgJ [Planctomycetota bacterium]|nr:MAG: bifunctional glutamate N-acetyltransferase/amino-acid acetyltransferase ArgJ [Planctomycetota bacterium]RLS96609.1 MAG: bifunctional glutamate N-acetyltransferase/amino-acid acetyltransferase ArgJ [Planctomycetota bacterium]
MSELLFPRGFRAVTAAASIKKVGRDDLALLVMPDGATAAALFTTNLFCAAPVQLSRQHLKDSRGHASALLLNSGCANAATGSLGASNAIDCVELIANALGVSALSVLVNSTGVIGTQLPMDRIAPLLAPLAKSACEADDAGSLEAYARAIMTTDTRPKMSTRVLQIGDIRIRLSGVAKGAGMIHPNMATMISVVTTDAQLSASELDMLLRDAADKSFHRISVDGDTSTNDSLFAFASGKAGRVDPELLRTALIEVCQELARMIVTDGEGFTRSMSVRVEGARTKEEATTVAKTVAQSLLVRCAVTGGDPNWGRIVAAAGRAGVRFDPSELRLYVGGIEIFAQGQPVVCDAQAVRAAFNGEHVAMILHLGATTGEVGDTNADEFLTSGLTEEYVRLNADYTT